MNLVNVGVKSNRIWREKKTFGSVAEILDSNEKKEYYLRQYHVQFSDAKVNIIMNQRELKAIARDQCQARENARAQLVLVLVELVARPSKTFEAKPKQYSDQLKTNSF